MTINWFPGHMHKSRKQIAELMPRVDVVVEVLDARLPDASSNPLLTELRRGRPCLKILNKCDLADPRVTDDWIKAFEARSRQIRALAVSAVRPRDLMRLSRLCRSLAPSRGVPGKPLRILVVGIPNVGKSTLINSLAGRRIAKVGDKPAITKAPQQVDLRNGLLLVDTPGVLAPNLADQQAALRLAASGAIGDNAMDYQLVAQFLVEFLRQHYPSLLQERFGLGELPEESEVLLEAIGRQRGCLAAGGVVDRQRAAEALLRDLQSGRLGRITLEFPEAVAKVSANVAKSGAKQP